MSNSNFCFKQFTINQESCAMKVGTDSVVLGAWANVPDVDVDKINILDIGTGTGILSLMMAQRYENSNIVAIDCDKDAIKQAKENFDNSQFADRITTSHCLIQDFQSIHLYDAIICNPPYFVNSLKCKDSSRTVARHTSTLTFAELMSNANRLLNTEGELSIIIPTDYESDIIAEAIICGFFLKRICKIKTTINKNAKRVMLAFAKMPVGTIERDEIIIGSDKYKSLTDDFYIK